MDNQAEVSPKAAEIAAWNVLAYLLAGPLVYGGLGVLVDRWLGTEPVFVGIGIVAGMFMSLYLIWFRYGTNDRRPLAASQDAGRTEGEQ